ncbi:hypothetical protein BJV82DRAFT_358969 [Fennellomyces sp. T-0311]|nr:hypothetical protein BJV82DRAFT_358969 [Fennellomyces sp. T-0311]
MVPCWRTSIAFILLSLNFERLCCTEISIHILLVHSYKQVCIFQLLLIVGGFFVRDHMELGKSFRKIALID